MLRLPCLTNGASMGLRNIGYAVCVALGLAASVSSAGAPPEPSAPAAAAAAPGFIDIAAGFQRLPGEDAHYMDADPEVSGGADPRWKPWNPEHLAVARARAQGPSPDVGEATRLPYLLSLRGEVAGAQAGLAAAKQRFPDSVGVYWSEGWIRLNLHDFEGALVAWQQAERLHGGQPFWVPYSKAIALVGAGDGEAALAWWRLAQAAYAPELDTAGAARTHFQHWRASEKKLLEQVIDLAYVESDRPTAPAMAARQAEIQRLIEARRVQMQAEAAEAEAEAEAKAQRQPQPE